ncbi:MAG: CDP-diacylglycerol--glycerol-3-phosphate 3-phosphatidyltransferase [Acidobacteria bacterium]|nr:MAG: CDP-diacylglycerol--glycerol-3-phosphate 3-phosphatidyltransferase [Acidobacteriota bacterium]REK02259.1 MAG: CDP-diacylglycerol--glycerol-3-phosphate 3-phosphatidyltransferase [Acidobacteriota bacterium]REK13938.1 MAG: CDP-diacylglycerol--glycerol-3-phosphate 3-phosphatidyltransferase [Acidobacteriota bacterium]REK41932.1 MAG: CDP-diacylglycerol--glycerol-3-phosphate 3-phosphatidyltransferase [Acidobacteriota bacterium]
MNLPNYLTLLRIFLVPILVVVLLTPLAESWFGIQSYALAIAIFLVATITDILDGHLARKRQQVSKFGALLDPIADKLLVSAVLIVLVEKHLAPAWAVVIILGREFVVTGLRSVAATEGIVISAQAVGKVKMWLQCIAIVALLVAAANSPPPVSNFGWQLPAAFWQVAEVQTAFQNLTTLSLTTNDWKVFGYLVGRASLWLAVLTACWSMYGYFRFFYLESKKKAAAEAASSEVSVSG